MKGIVLAGGSGTRLYPATKVVCKQLLPVYDKPLIYYPLSVLMLSGIREILIISTPQDLPRFRELLGTGENIGLNLNYAVQSAPRGLADAFRVGGSFIGRDSVALVLGDNIFYGQGLPEMLREASAYPSGATIFGYYVNDPQRYGVVEFDEELRVVSIEEKPTSPKTNYAVVGLYFYNNEVVDIAREIKPSARGEIEITDVNRVYLEQGKLQCRIFGRGIAWFDTGTHDSLADATTFVRVLEERQGIKISCIEEIAYAMRFIDKERLRDLAQPLLKSGYGEYLLRVIGRAESREGIRT